MRKTNKFLSLALSFALVCGTIVIPTKANADNTDLSKWKTMIAIDFGASDSLAGTNHLLPTPVPEAEAITSVPILNGNGTWTYDATTVQGIYNENTDIETKQKIGFDKVLPAAVSTTGGDYFKDYVWSPNGEEYSFSADLPVGQYYVYVYTGNKTKDRSNTTFVRFGDEKIEEAPIKYDQTSNGASQFYGATNTEMVYIVDVKDNGQGYGTLKAFFSDNTLENEAYAASHQVTVASALENEEATFDFYAETDNALDSAALTDSIVTSRLNGIEIAPVNTPVHATKVETAETLKLESTATATLTVDSGVENVTDRIAYLSANPEVATIDIYTGAITPVTTGTAKLYAYNAYLNQYSETTLTVIPETTITLEPRNVSLKVDGDEADKTSTIEASFNASDSDIIEWSVDNSDIIELGTATFTAGETAKSTITVTAKATGTATITAKRTDSNKTAQCTVTVTRPVKSVEFVDTEGNALADDAFVIVDEGKNATVKANVLPKDASNPRITYTSSDDSIATVTANDDGTCEITGIAGGEATITAASESNSELTDSIKVKVIAKPTPTPTQTPATPTQAPTQAPTQVTPTPNNNQVVASPAPTATVDTATTINVSGKATTKIKVKKSATFKVTVKNSTLKSISYKIKSGKKFIKIKKTKKSLKITGKKKGTAKLVITIKAKDGTRRKLTRTIKVK